MIKRPFDFVGRFFYCTFVGELMIIRIMKALFNSLGFDPATHKVKTEMMAGLTTFLTMSYILAVNPLMLGDAGMDKGAVFSASISEGIVLGMLSYVLVKVLTGRFKEVSVVLFVLAAFFVLKYIASLL
jgi:xanthine/uracil/vitamin C permease (AzgA family)